VDSPPALEAFGEVAAAHLEAHPPNLAAAEATDAFRSLVDFGNPEAATDLRA
jgi:hypothetical protein